MFFPAFLFLDKNIVYRGWSFFNNFQSYGEIVFNTGMTGYQEIITDPSYSGQIITFTYPELGNTGLNEVDSESSFIHAKGIIAKNICLYSSNWRSKISLKDYIIKKKIPHIIGIDTRYLTKYIRSNGVMSCYIMSNNNNIYDLKIPQLPKYLLKNIDLIKRITSRKNYLLKVNYRNNLFDNYLNQHTFCNKNLNINIIVIDLGFKLNIINRLLCYGCNIIVLSALADYSLIQSYKPDGILLSNGPGDPSLAIYAIDTVKQLVNFANLPIFGICMGHQILNLALGSQTFKLKFGHRGLNHPSGLQQKSEITSQNHGFVVSRRNFNQKNVKNLISISHFNFNDKTIAGILHTKKPIFSVQYHPEASPGPHDSDYLFNIFINLVKLIKNIN